MLISQSQKKIIMKVINKVRAVINGIGKKINGIVLMALKFIGFYFAISIATGDLGGLYQGEGFLTKGVVKLGLAIVCTILPARFGTLLVLGIISYFMVKVSLFGGIVGAILILLIFLITVIFTPEYAYLLLLVPFFAQKGWFLLVPMFVGIYGTPMAFVGLIMGALMWSAYSILPQLMAYGATVIDSGSLGDLLEFLPAMIVKSGLQVASEFVANKALLFYGILIAVVALIVWFIGKLKVEYAPYWAILSAGIFGIIGILILRSQFGFAAGPGRVIFGTLCVMLFAAFLRFMDVPLDYRFVRNLTFSDDEFFYQVRLTPLAKSYKEASAALLAKKKRSLAKGETNAETKLIAEKSVADETKVSESLAEEVTKAENTSEKTSSKKETIVMTKQDKDILNSQPSSEKTEKETISETDPSAQKKKEKSKISKTVKKIKKFMKKMADTITGVGANNSDKKKGDEKATQEEVNAVLEENK